MLRYDFKKILFNKRNLTLFIILLIINSILFYYLNTTQDISQKDYKAIHQEISGMEVKNDSSFLQEEIDKIEYVQRVDGGMDVTHYIETYGMDWINDCNKHKDLLYDNNTLLKVLEEYEHLIEYPEFINKIEKQTDNTVSIFKDSSQFNKERQQKIKEQYADKVLTAGESAKGSFGIEMILKFIYVDVIASLLLLYMLYIQTKKEEEVGFFAYSKTLLKGNVQNYTSKIISIVISVLLYFVFAFMLMYLISGYQYGFADLSSPIQSVKYCGSVPDTLTIVQFLIITVFMRSMIFTIVAMMLYAFIFILKHYVYGVLCVTMLFIIANTLSILSADPNSVFSFLSLSRIFHWEYSYIEVAYVSLFNHALYFFIIHLMMIIMAIILLVVAYYFYKNNEYKRRIFFKLKHENKHFHSLRYYESKKTWVQGFGILFICLLLLFNVFALKDIRSLSTIDDQIIAYYIDNLGASLTDETLKNIEEENERFENIQIRLAITDSAAEAAKLNNEFNAYFAFKEYENRMRLLQKDTSQKLLKEDQTRLLFEMKSFYASLLLGFIIIMIILCMYSYGKEQESGVEVLQKTSIIGKQKVFSTKYIVICLGMIVTWIVLQVCILIHNCYMYTNKILFENIQDLQLLKGFPFSINIITYLILQTIMQLFLLAMLCYCLLYIFSKTNLNKVMGIIFVLVLGIPLFLIINGNMQSTLGLSLFYPFINPIEWLVSLVFITLCFVICVYRKKEEENA